MDIDWVVSIAAFLMFVSWALFFYTNAVLPIDPLEAESSLLDVNERVLDYLTVDAYVSNIKVTVGADNANSSVYYFNYSWSSGKNTTRVYNGTSGQLECIMFDANGSVYFQGNLSNGDNYFSLRYRNDTTTMNCSGSFAIVNESGVVPWPAEKRSYISLSRFSTMNSTAYDDMRAALSLTRNFRLELNISGTVTNYGPSLPSATNVYATSHTNRIEETNQNVTVRIMSW